MLREAELSDVLGPIIVSMLFCSTFIGPPSHFRLEEQETKLLMEPRATSSKSKTPIWKFETTFNRGDFNFSQNIIM